MGAVIPPNPLESAAGFQVSTLGVLLRKIRWRQARVGIIGLGYVGFPLAIEFSRAGFQQTGFEIDEQRLEQVNSGVSCVGDISDTELAAKIASERLRATSDFRGLASVDTASICVSTPFRMTRGPGLSFVIQPVEAVADHLHPGELVIVEGTTYPGTTEEVVLPRLERGGLSVGEDFFVAFSPERVDPGNRQFHTKNIPKVVGGITPRCTSVAGALYRSCVDHVLEVSSAHVSEMVKLLENTFRNVNIALANEMALLSHKFGIDVWEVIEAASSKPFGFMSFYSGPGVGGHCIPIDPAYLAWKARSYGFEPRLIEAVQEINSGMPGHVVERITDALNDFGKALHGARVHTLGVSYKRDVADVRESPAIDIMHLLAEKKACLSYTDPLVPRLSGPGLDLESEPLSNLREKDYAVIGADHGSFDYRAIVRDALPIADTGNALRNFQNGKICCP